ncbi:MAG: hypothetical protein DRP69_06075, partial [Candidatus Duberdicusella sinuisediminis]
VHRAYPPFINRLILLMIPKGRICPFYLVVKVKVRKIFYSILTFFNLHLNLLYKAVPELLNLTLSFENKMSSYIEN